MIEPSLPYIHIPDHDFTYFSEHMSRNYNHVMCKYSSGYCKINNRCSDEIDLIDWEINIALEDGRKIVPIKIKDTKGSMLINGEDVGDSENTCYLPV